MDSSSDSEDDCLGNIALKLHSVKNKFTKDKIDSNDSTEAEVVGIVKKVLTTSKNTTKPTSESQQGGEKSASNEDLIDTLVASSSKRVTRSKLAAKKDSVDAGLKTPAKKSAKAKKKADTETPTRSKVATKRGSVEAGLKTPAKKSSKAKKKAKTETPTENSADTGVEDLNTSNTSQRQRGRGRGRGRNSGKNARMWLPTDPIERAKVLSAFYARQPADSTAQQSSNTSQRGRGRGRGRNRARGRKRNSGRKIKMWLPMDPIERARVLSAFYARQQ